MARNLYGGGSQTNVNGLKFEQETDLATALAAIDGYSVRSSGVYFFDVLMGVLAGKHALYGLLKAWGVDYTELISKKMLPDEAIHVFRSNTVFIIEKKFQSAAGSVDEKLQTCDFKKRQYTRLFESTGRDVEYIYILNDWFKHPSYRDVLDYIEDRGCHYYFNQIPIDFLGLPHLTQQGIEWDRCAE